MALISSEREGVATTPDRHPSDKPAIKANRIPGSALAHVKAAGANDSRAVQPAAAPAPVLSSILDW